MMVLLDTKMLGMLEHDIILATSETGQKLETLSEK
jgi:hypothetical protein